MKLKISENTGPNWLYFPGKLFKLWGGSKLWLPDLTRHASCKTTSSKKSTDPKFYKTWEKGGKGDQLNSSINVLSKEVRFSVGY